MTIIKYFERQLEKVREQNKPRKSAQELLKELNSLKGLNVEERKNADCKYLCSVS